MEYRKWLLTAISVIIIYTISTAILLYFNRLLLDDYARYHALYPFLAYPHIVFLTTYFSDLYFIGAMYTLRLSGIITVLGRTKTVLIVSVVIAGLNAFPIYYLLSHFFISGIFSIFFPIILATNVFVVIIIYPYYTMIAAQLYCNSSGKCVLNLGVKSYLTFLLIMIISSLITHIYDIPPISILVDHPVYVPPNLRLTRNAIEVLNHASLSLGMLLRWYTLITLYVVLGRIVLSRYYRKKKE